MSLKRVHESEFSYDKLVDIFVYSNVTEDYFSSTGEEEDDYDFDTTRTIGMYFDCYELRSLFKMANDENLDETIDVSYLNLS